jgi:hypothetical protein
MYSSGGLSANLESMSYIWRVATFGHPLPAKQPSFQCRFVDLEPEVPNALISNLADRLPGVGISTARKMCESIGKDSILRVLNGEGPEGGPDWRETTSQGGWQQQRFNAILNCNGVGPSLAASICTAWDEGGPDRNAEDFLVNHGFNHALAARVCAFQKNPSQIMSFTKPQTASLFTRKSCLD